VTTLPNDPSANMSHAKSRLEMAMERLERAIETRAEKVAMHGGATIELDAARAEIGRLKETNKVVSARLDAAIGRVKVLLEE
jgi:hypothetical protein